MIVGGILSGLVSLLVDAVQAVLDGFAAIVNGAIAAWPVGMPDLPAVPSELVTAWGWVLWTPLPVASALALFFFLVGVEVLWQVIAIALRWFKVIDG